MRRRALGRLIQRRSIRELRLTNLYRCRCGNRKRPLRDGARNDRTAAHFVGRVMMENERIVSPETVDRRCWSKRKRSLKISSSLWRQGRRRKLKERKRQILLSEARLEPKTRCRRGARSFVYFRAANREDIDASSAIVPRVP